METDFKRIRLLVLDVDGVLTDGQIVYSDSSEELKAFDCKDGAGLKYWKRAGGLTAILTGRESVVVQRRAAELSVDVVRQNAKVKLPVFEEILAELGVAPEEAAMIGDDLADLPVQRACGFSAAPSDAVAEVCEAVDYVCRRPGGHGAVREVIELILRRAGSWETILERYREGPRP